MKRIALSALCGVLLATGALAQAQQSSGAGLQLPPEQMQRLDKDKNGSVSRAEYQEFMEASFDNMDANKDGALVKNEFPASVTVEQFAVMDVNKDGKVTREEFLTQVLADYDEAAR